MEVPWAGSFRALALAGLGVFSIAVALGRMNPEPPSRGGPVAGRPAGFEGISDDPPGPAPRLLDLATGRLEPLVMPAGERLDKVSYSPRVDGRGEGQVVGSWLRVDPLGRTRDSGLARLVYPSGRVLDRVMTETSLAAPPCWYPDGVPRVLFASPGGDLHHFAFEDGAGGPGDGAPRPVTWRRLPRGASGVRVESVTWPADPILGGRLLASLSLLPAGGDSRWQPSGLWWLQLDAAGGEVIAAGRLVRRRWVAGTDRGAELQRPAVGRSAGGRPLLAYLARPPKAQGWRVIVAPLRADASTGAPYVAGPGARVVAEGCGLLAPGFGADGRWVAAIPSGHHAAADVLRIPVGSAPDLAVAQRHGRRPQGGRHHRS